MSFLTDAARAPWRSEPAPCNDTESLEALVAANPSRRTVLRNGLLGLSALTVPSLAGLSTSRASARTTGTASGDYAITFKSVPISRENRVSVPEGYRVDILFSAGDAVEPGASPFSGAFADPQTTAKWAGGCHDGMEMFPLPGVDANQRALLAVNHEFPDWSVLMAEKFDPKTASDSQRALALSAVGVSIIEIARGEDGNWAIQPASPYNRRYSGSTLYRPSGPAAARLSDEVIGTLNNCSSGRTPWGTYLTCEEATVNYFDPSRPREDYGWVVEIDPMGTLAPPTKRTAMGRFEHENTAYLANADNRVAFYMGDDSRPGCIYKFVPNKPFDADDRAANRDLLDDGTLYVARFAADGTGEWRALVHGQNGLTASASDPGNVTQFETPPPAETVSFVDQADVVINCKSAARVAGGTMMDRPEWVTIAPDGKAIFVSLTNNAGRRVADAANPRVANLHGQILKFREADDSPLATRFRWELLVVAGEEPVTPGHATKGDAFSSPDGMRIDPQGRLWVQTDHTITGASGTPDKAMVDVFGNNAMFHVDPVTGDARRFLVGPVGCEITGIAHTPDLATFFVNIQHPKKDWPEAGKAPRSSTIVIRREDGRPFGA